MEPPGSSSTTAPSPDAAPQPAPLDPTSVWAALEPDNILQPLPNEGLDNDTGPDSQPVKPIAVPPAHDPDSTGGDDQVGHSQHRKRVQSIRQSTHADRTKTASGLLDHHRQFRRAQLSRGQVFSWPRCFMSIFSYALLLTDVIRTGLGIRKVDSDKPYEPDSVLYYGPYAYPVVRISMADRSSPMALPTWLFKFDTTSVGMRAVVESLDLKTWPPCINYKGDCAEVLSADTIFTMVDSMIEGVANHYPAASRGQNGTGHLSLRVKAHWKDRLYHHVLPFIFQRYERHTVHAIHYDAKKLNHSSYELCGAEAPRPVYCGDPWTHYNRLCSPTERLHFLCDHVSDVWTHILQRYRELKVMYSNNTLDLFIVEGSQDFSQPSMVYHGRKSMNIVTFIRIQDCSKTPCTTVAIDDYRYEAGALTTNVSSWYSVVGTLRVIGQVYAWVRLAFLIVGCYVAQPVPESTTNALTATWTRLKLALRTVFLIPSQVVIYGSVFPIACYLAAHLIDSSAFYEIVAQQFNTPLGQFKLDIVKFIQMCAVSMRSVWMAAFVLHIIHAAYTSRSTSPVHSVPVIPEFALTFMASLTVFAQIRALGWRSTEVLEVNESVPRAETTPFRMLSYDSTRGFIYQFLIGTTIDPQCLVCTLGILLGIFAVLYSLHKAFPDVVQQKAEFLSWMSVPYGAGRLWPTNALVVSWSVVRESNNRAGALASAKSWAAVQSRRASAVFMKRKSNAVPVKSDSMKAAAKAKGANHNLEFMNYLVNLAVMTDPITWFSLRILGGHLVAMYQSKRTKRSFLLPYGLTSSEADLPIDWDDLELLMVLDAKDLSWWDLLQCG